LLPLFQLISFLRRIQDATISDEKENSSATHELAELKNILAALPEKLPEKSISVGACH